jgi:hypothetical protein
MGKDRPAVDRRNSALDRERGDAIGEAHGERVGEGVRAHNVARHSFQFRGGAIAPPRRYDVINYLRVSQFAHAHHERITTGRCRARTLDRDHATDRVHGLP